MMCDRDLGCRSLSFVQEGSLCVESYQLRDPDRDTLALEAVEDDNLVDPVEELRTEVLAQGVGDLGLALLGILLAEDILAADIRGHDEDRIAEVHGTTLAIGDAAIVVLGSGTPNGKASPVLAARLDLALKQAALYPQAVVVVSGGVDFGQTRSEAAIMGDYLRNAGLGPDRILQEERSTSTEENLVFTKPLLAQRGLTLQEPVQLVTSDFHTLRAGWIARSTGYRQVSMAGAPTPLYVRYNAWLREYFAVLLGFVRREF